LCGIQPHDRLTLSYADQLACDKLGCEMLLEAKLGMRVQVLPPGGHFAVKQIDEMRNLHD
jgi:hypothetical protein